MSASTQIEKAQRFQALHQQPGTFVIPNPWDVGTARLLAHEGFQALATSSAAAAGSLGVRDYQLTREQALAHCAQIAGGTSLPVSGDLENGFGDSPEAVAETVRLAAAAGLVGCSIEDATGNPAQPLYEFSHAVERIHAAVTAARSLPIPFVLTARAQNFLAGQPDLDATIARLQAYEKAGADVLFAPGLPTLDAVRTVCSAVKKPVNFMVGMRGQSFTLEQLAEAGVKRVSLAASLYRAAMTGFLDAVSEIRQRGTFTYVERSVSAKHFNARLP